MKDTGLKALGPDWKHQVTSQAGQLCADCFLAQQSTQHTLTPGGFAQSGTGMREGCEKGKERMGRGGVTCPFASHVSLLSRSGAMERIPGGIEQIVQGLTAMQQHRPSVQGASRLLEAGFTVGTGSR